MDDDLAATRVLRWVSRWRVPLLVVAMLLPLLCFNGQWRPNADSAALLSVARELRESGAATTPLNWERNVNPVAARVLAMLGEDPVLPAMLLWLVPVYVGLLACHGMARAAGVGPASATLLTLGVAVNARFLVLGSTLLVDIWFAAGLWLTMWGVVMWGRRPSGVRDAGIKSALLILAGLAAMASTRSVVVVVLGAAMFAGLWEAWRRRRLDILAGFGLLCVLAGVLAWFTPPVREDVLLLVKVLTVEQGARTGTNLWRIFTADLTEGFFSVDMTPWVSPALAVLLIGAGLAWWLRSRAASGGAWWLGAWGWLWLAFLVQWVVFLPDMRYVLPALPVLVWGGWRVLVWLNRRIGEPWGGYLLLVGIVLYAVPNAIKTADLVFEQRRGDLIEHYRNGAYLPVFVVSEFLVEHTPSDAVLLTSIPRQAELTWLSGRWTLPRLDPVVVGSSRVYLLGSADESLQADLAQHGLAVGKVVFEQAGAEWAVRELAPAAQGIESMPSIANTAPPR